MNRMERAENQINVQAYVRNLMFQLRHRKLNSQFIKDIFQKCRKWSLTGNHRLYRSIVSRFFSFRDRPLYDFCTVQFNPQGPPTLG